MAENQNGVPIEAESTIEINATVEMGGSASENNAEAWAVGQRGGVDVSETDQTYHNNSKYYAERAASSATAGAQSETNAQQAANQAAQSMRGAQDAAQAAQGAVDDAEEAAEQARAAAQEAADTVIAAQGSGILYIGSDGVPYVLE